MQGNKRFHRTDLLACRSDTLHGLCLAKSASWTAPGFSATGLAAKASLKCLNGTADEEESFMPSSSLLKALVSSVQGAFHRLRADTGRDGRGDGITSAVVSLL